MNGGIIDEGVSGGTITTLARNEQADLVRTYIHEAIRHQNWQGKRVLVIVPDATRTAPVGLPFQALFDLIGAETAAFDVMIALGTHSPMSPDAIRHRLELTPEQRDGRFAKVRFFNHVWDDPAHLTAIGTIAASEIDALTEGRFAMDVPVTVNRAIFDYDHLFIIGPVFPHEVVGFSGGNKYLFPGVSGPEVLNFFHWLGGVITNPKIIGNKWTPVRKVIDKAASLVTVPRTALCMVVDPKGPLVGFYAGPTEAAWSQAADLSAKTHITLVERPFSTVLSCAPPMYDEIWVGAKCMYKLEPVVADGGELIIYGPHIHDIARTHDAVIRRIGYHTRDYFLAQWDRFKNEPWGVLAHSTHVKGIGTYVDGVEKPRIQVTLATGIPESVCREINLGYRDPASIDPAQYANRESEGVLLVPKAGEMLFRLQDPPEWARG